MMNRAVYTLISKNNQQMTSEIPGNGTNTYSLDAVTEITQILLEIENIYLQP